MAVLERLIQTYVGGKRRKLNTLFYGYVVFNVDKDMFLLNDVLNKFFVRLYGIGLMVKDHKGNGRENSLAPLNGPLFPISNKGSLTPTTPDN